MKAFLFMVLFVVIAAAQNTAGPLVAAATAVCMQTLWVTITSFENKCFLVEPNKGLDPCCKFSRQALFLVCQDSHRQSNTSRNNGIFLFIWFQMQPGDDSVLKQYY